MNSRYVPEDDMLHLELADTPSVEGEEVTDGVVLHYDAEGRIVSIEIDEASRRANLDGVHRAGIRAVDGDTPPGRVYTAAEVAARLAITPFAVQKIRKAMRDAGLQVGIRPDLASSLLSERDVENIEGWRNAHPRGRPRKAAHL